MKRHSAIKTTGRISDAQAVGRALRIARTFSDRHPEWRLADLARELQLSKPTAFRLLGALEEGGLVVRTQPAGGYRLGPGAIELGARAQRANSVTAAARPELEAITRETGETSSVEILIGAETLILDEVLGGHVLGTSPSVGTRWPAHAASTGKVLLAAALSRDPTLVTRLAAEAGGRLGGFTPRTIRSPARLASELARIARQGYAVANGELEVGYVAIGAPVRRHDGEVIAAISLGGPSARFTDSRIRALVRPVSDAAARVSQRLGWCRSAPLTHGHAS